MDPQSTRATLLDRQQALTRRLNAIREDLARSHSSDWPEQAQERENDEVLEGIAAQTADELKLINRALERLEQGIYGTCSNCGKSISPERLEAIPEATTCIECA